MSERSDPSARRAAVTGAGGLIGAALTGSLRRDGWEVLRLVRRRAGGADEVEWDPEAGRMEAERLEGVRAVVHLAGENVGERWSSAKKERIRSSRVRGTRLVAETLASLRHPPEVLVCASAIGYYGDRGDERLDESSPPGTDFLARVAVEWEEAAQPARRAGVRVANLRFGVVLTRGGGALQRMLPVFQLGGGGRLGSGRQWMSWISLPDAVAAIRFAVDRAELRGPVNVVAPEPATNEQFTRALGAALGRPALLAVPEFALRLAFGEMADATLLASQRAVPGRLREAGFHFQHPRIEEALRDVIREDA